MSTFSKQLLSGSSNGQQILITATSNAAAQTIHTAVSGTASFDEVWLYVYNDNSGSVTVSILWGGTSEPDNVIRATIPSQSGRFLLCDGMLLQNGLAIKAYASFASAISIDGFINRIS